jgi:hypothetical protein
MAEITKDQLARILAIEPGEEADTAFATTVMGWERRTVGWWSGEALEAIIAGYRPTQGDVSQWWAGVEKLRERFRVIIDIDKPLYCVSVIVDRETLETFDVEHENPAVALLRAAAEAIYATQAAK